MWLVGVVVRRYIDYLIILLIPTALVLTLLLQQHHYFFNVFRSLGKKNPKSQFLLCTVHM